MGVLSHPNDPYPTALTLTRDRRADQLLAEHAVAVKTFQTAARVFLAAVIRLETPLGSVCAHYDMSDIEEMVGEWLIPRDERVMEQAAMDAANTEAS